MKIIAKDLAAFVASATSVLSDADEERGGRATLLVALDRADHYPHEAFNLLIRAIVEYAEMTDDPAAVLGLAVETLETERRELAGVPTEVTSG